MRKFLKNPGKVLDAYGYAVVDCGGRNKHRLRGSAPYDRRRRREHRGPRDGRAPEPTVHTGVGRGGALGRGVGMRPAGKPVRRVHGPTPDRTTQPVNRRRLARVGDAERRGPLTLRHRRGTGGSGSTASPVIALPSRRTHLKSRPVEHAGATPVGERDGQLRMFGGDSDPIRLTEGHRADPAQDRRRSRFTYRGVSASGAAR